MAKGWGPEGGDSGPGSTRQGQAHKSRSGLLGLDQLPQERVITPGVQLPGSLRRPAPTLLLDVLIYSL